MHRKLAAPALVTLFLVAHASLASAKGRAVNFNIRDPNTPLVVDVKLKKPVILAFSSEVKAAGSDQSTDVVKLHFEPFSREVRLKLLDGAKDGPIEIVTEAYSLDILLRIVPPTAEAWDRVEFYDGHQIEKRAQEAFHRQKYQSNSNMVAQGVGTVWLRHRPVGDDKAIVLQYVKLVKLGHDHVFSVSLKNRSYPLCALENVRIRDASGQQHTQFVEVISGPDPKDPRRLAEIPKGHSVRINLVADDLEHLGPFAYFDFIGPEGMVLATEQINILDPISANRDRISIQAVGVLGAIDLQKGEDDPRNEYTSTSGLGIRVTYGLTESLSLAGQLSILSTGEATYGDNTKAQATIYRALVGATLSAGDTYVPYLDFGIGPQVSSFTMKTASGADDGSNQATNTIIAIGAGVDAWHGETLVFGLSATLVAPIAGRNESQSFELGAHAGFAWKRF